MKRSGVMKPPMGEYDETTERISAIKQNCCGMMFQKEVEIRLLT